MIERALELLDELRTVIKEDRWEPKAPFGRIVNLNQIIEGDFKKKASCGSKINPKRPRL